MPAASQYVAPTDPERSDFNGELQVERRTRLLNYRTALRYYLGYHDNPNGLREEDFMDNQGRGPRIQEDDEAPDDTTIINMVKMTVDRTISFLFPEVPRVELDPEQVERTDREKWVDAFFEKNGGLELLTKIGLRGALAGHSFVRLKAVDKKKANREKKFPKMISLDPTSVMIFWAADDMAEILWYEYKYISGKDVIIEDYVKEDDDTWTIYSYKAEGLQPHLLGGIPTHHGASMYASLDHIDFSVANFKRTGKEPHTSEIPPIISWAHQPNPDDIYGLQEFSYSEKHLQDMLNKIATLRMTIVRENSAPVDVATGADIQEIRAQAGEDNGGLVALGNEKARVTRLEMKGDLTGITATIDKLTETFLAIARVVLLKGEAKDLQRVTNASVRTLFLDMLSKNALLQSSYGRALKQIVTLALWMGFEQSGVEEAPTDIENMTIRFNIPLPVDMTEVIGIAEKAVGMGVMSKNTAAKQLNLDWAFEQAAMETELDQQIEKQSKMMEAMPDQEIGPDGKPTGKPSATAQHEMGLEQTKVAASAKASAKPALDKPKKAG